MRAAGPHQFQHGKLRDCETLAARFNDESRNDRQRERNLYGECRSYVRPRLQFYGAADLLHIGADHVHADSTPGNASDGGCGRKAGRKDQVADFRIRLGGQFALAQQTLFQREGADPLNVETAAVIGNLDDDVAALVAGRQPNPAGSWLAGCKPFSRAFDAVIGAVADEMRQRVLDHLQDLPVEFGIGTVHLEVDVFSKFAAEVAHDPRQFLPRIANWLHARLHHAFLQLGGYV